MPAVIPETFADLLSRHSRAFAHLALTLKDGTPQVTPIWFDWDGAHFVINTARGRVKDKVLKRHPVVALCISDPANPYRYLQVRGRVVAETETGAYDKICDLAEKYWGRREFNLRPGEVRVTYKIAPVQVDAHG